MKERGKETTEADEFVLRSTYRVPRHESFALLLITTYKIKIKSTDKNIKA